MVRVLNSRAVHTGFETCSVLNFFYSLNLCCFVTKNFIFKQDLDLEPVKVNSTTSRGMCRLHKDIFSFLSIYGMGNSIFIRF